MSIERRDKLNTIVPLHLSAGLYACRYAGLKAEKLYSDIRLSMEVQDNCYRTLGCDDSPYYCFPNGDVTDLGGSLVFSEKPGNPVPKIIYPVSSREEARTYELPDIEKRSNLRRRIEFARVAGGKTAVPAGTPFSLLALLVETNHLLRILVREPETVIRLLDLMRRYILENADMIIAEFGAENCCASMGLTLESKELISRKLVEELEMPFIASIVNEMRARGVNTWGVHFCGDQSDNIGLIRDLRLPEGTAYSFDHKIDMARACEMLGRYNSYEGNVPTELLSSGSPEEVYSYSAEIIGKMLRRTDSFALAPSCDLPVNARFENIEAMKAAAKMIY